MIRSKWSSMVLALGFSVLSVWGVRALDAWYSRSFEADWHLGYARSSVKILKELIRLGGELEVASPIDWALAEYKEVSGFPVIKIYKIYLTEKDRRSWAKTESYEVREDLGKLDYFSPLDGQSSFGIRSYVDLRYRGTLGSWSPLHERVALGFLGSLFYCIFYGIFAGKILLRLRVNPTSLEGRLRSWIRGSTKNLGDTGKEIKTLARTGLELAQWASRTRQALNQVIHNIDQNIEWLARSRTTLEEWLELESHSQPMREEMSRRLQSMREATERLEQMRGPLLNDLKEINQHWSELLSDVSTFTQQIQNTVTLVKNQAQKVQELEDFPDWKSKAS